MNYLRQQINIVNVGAVSAGKSTLINALFVEQYSDMAIKRTTTLPQIYNEISDIKEIDIDIHEKNKKYNKEMMEKTQKGEMKLSIDDIKEINYSVPRIFDFLTGCLKEDVFLTLYDLPGLNDSLTKDLYYEYLNTNFLKFDIILFTVDINSALNTCDEMEILKCILTNIKKNNTNGIKTELIVLLNKSDDMKKYKNGNILPNDDEVMEMYEQAKDIINNEIKEIIPDLIVKVLCISCEDAYIYRMYKKDPKCELDNKYLNKFGSNEFGKNKWARLSDSDKKKEIVKLFKKHNYDNVIELTGFRNFEQHLKEILTYENQYELLTNHIKLQLNTIKSHGNILENLNVFFKIRENLNLKN